MNRLSREENYLETARGDARSIENNIHDYRICGPQICNNAALLVEKTLKSIYEFYGIKPKRVHDLRQLAHGLEKLGYLNVDERMRDNCTFLSQEATAGKYISFESSEYGEVLEAVICANEIVDEIGKQGYEVVRINVPAMRLRDLFKEEIDRDGISVEDDRPTESLSELSETKIEESSFQERSACGELDRDFSL